MCACVCLSVRLCLSVWMSLKKRYWRLSGSRKNISLHSEAPLQWHHPLNLIFQAPLQAVHLKKWRLSLLATLQNKMRLRSAGNAPEKRIQRSLLIYRERKLVLWAFDLSFCEVTALGINFHYLSPPFSLSSPLREYGAASMASISIWRKRILSWTSVLKQTCCICSSLPSPWLCHLPNATLSSCSRASSTWWRVKVL